MKVVQLLFFISLVGLLHAHKVQPELKALQLNSGRNFTSGTNPHLDEIFIGRCYAVIGSSSLYSPSSNNNIIMNEYDPYDVCTKLWGLFASAFQFQNDSNILPSAFLPFFSHPLIISSLQSSPNNALFWSGVSDLIPTYQTFTNHFVMETSSIVEIVGDLMFCGSTSDVTGFDYDSCVWGDYNLTGDSQWHGTWVSYWAAASLAYAPLVSGNITILLRGSPSPYRKSSFFATCELPNLPISKIPFIQILVVPAEDGAVYDECGEGSMQELVNDLVNVGFHANQISCQNDPPVFKLMQCLSTPLSSQCLLV